MESKKKRIYEICIYRSYVRKWMGKMDSIIIIVCIIYYTQYYEVYEFIYVYVCIRLQFVR